MSELHDSSGHDRLAPTDVVLHLAATAVGHHGLQNQTLDLLGTVTPEELAEYRTRADSNGDQVDLGVVLHERLHDEAEGPEAKWKRAVRVELVRRGFNPQVVESVLGDWGFGLTLAQHFPDDAAGFVDTLVSELDIDDPDLRLNKPTPGPGYDQSTARKQARAVGGIAIGARPGKNGWIVGGWASQPNERWIVVLPSGLYDDGEFGAQ